MKESLIPILFGGKINREQVEEEKKDEIIYDIGF
jgi:hypothetical protein